MVTSAAACAVITTGVVELTVTVQLPLESVPAAAAHPSDDAVSVLLFASFSVTTGCWLAIPVFTPLIVWLTLTMKECEWLTSFTPFGLIEMFAPQCSNEPLA